MKRTSNRIALAGLLLFGVLPALSSIVNGALARRTERQLLPVMQRIADNDLRVVDITGRKASAGMLYVQNAWQRLNVVELRVTPRDVEVRGDTLHLHLADQSDVYQGRIMLADIEQVVRNGRATTLRRH